MTSAVWIAKQLVVHAENDQEWFVSGAQLDVTPSGENDSICGIHERPPGVQEDAR
jgi:hypothetical protein